MKCPQCNSENTIEASKYYEENFQETMVEIKCLDCGKEFETQAERQADSP